MKTKEQSKKKGRSVLARKGFPVLYKFLTAKGHREFHIVQDFTGLRFKRRS